MNYNQNHNHEQHPTHPVRNVFYCICCFFFSLAFSYLWVWQVLDFEDTRRYVLIAALILVGALIGLALSFRRSHRIYFRQRKLHKLKYHR